jgi:Ca2+-binding EF-hand superfamily protein
MFFPDYDIFKNRWTSKRLSIAMDVLLPEQIEELSRIFRAFDSQNKQSLSVRELGACFK